MLCTSCIYNVHRHLSFWLGFNYSCNKWVNIMIGHQVIFIFHFGYQTAIYIKLIIKLQSSKGAYQGFTDMDTEIIT